MQRDSFLHTFFKKGAQLTEDLLKENDQLRHRVLEIEEENTSLRTQLASDEAIRDALRKIEQLEREKHELLSHVSEVAAVSTRSLARYQEVENDLADLANLYVASDQLHSTLELGRVLTHVKELLEQLVGARAQAVYFLDESRGVLAPIASHGIDRDRLPLAPIRVADDSPPSSTRSIERAFLTGLLVVEDIPTAGPDYPVACMPLLLHGAAPLSAERGPGQPGTRAVGVVAVYALLAQKAAFTQLDHELFRMLGAHAATAITGALLWRSVHHKLPSP